jgi:hypothetical protein
VARSTGVELRFHTGNLATVADGRLRSVHLYARGEDLLREFGLDA